MTVLQSNIHSFVNSCADPENFLRGVQIPRRGLRKISTWQKLIIWQFQGVLETPCPPPPSGSAHVIPFYLLFIYFCFILTMLLKSIFPRLIVPVNYTSSDVISASSNECCFRTRILETTSLVSYTFTALKSLIYAMHMTSFPNKGLSVYFCEM